jgi:hypothetical protein
MQVLNDPPPGINANGYFFGVMTVAAENKHIDTVLSLLETLEQGDERTSRAYQVVLYIRDLPDMMKLLALPGIDVTSVAVQAARLRPIAAKAILSVPGVDPAALEAYETEEKARKLRREREKELDPWDKSRVLSTSSIPSSMFSSVDD